MSHETLEAPATFDGHETELEQYSSLSGLAIGGLVLGLMSPLALMSPVLWAVPVIAAAVCITAIVQIGRDERQLSGRRLAVTGLAFAVVFGTAAVAGMASRNYWVRQEAVAVADEWLQYVLHGQTYQAHQMLYPPHQRAPFDDSLPDFYAKNPEARGDHDAYIASEAVSTLIGLEDRATIRDLGVLEHLTAGTQDVLLKQYHVQYRDGDQPKELYVQLSMERKVPPGQRAGAWSVGKPTWSPKPID